MCHDRHHASMADISDVKHLTMLLNEAIHMILYSEHRHSPITVEKVFAIYFLVLGLMAILNWLFPVQSAAIASFFLPRALSDLSHPYIRYRMVLFLGASGLLLVLAAFILPRGIGQSEPVHLKKFRWSALLFLMIGTGGGWSYYPIFAMQTESWMGNDIFYFFVTILFFLGMQMIFQAAVYKLKILMKPRAC